MKVSTNRSIFPENYDGVTKAENNMNSTLVAPQQRRELFYEQSNKILNKNLKLEEKNTLDSQKLVVRCYKDLFEDIEKKVFPLAGNNKYLLLELPNEVISPIAMMAFYKLQCMGYVPIIARAETNNEFRKNTNQLFKIVNIGVLIQISASSITGLNGRKLRRFGLKLCRNNLVHFISTDGLKIDQKQTHLKWAYEYIGKKVSKNFAEYLQENAQHILRGIDFHIRKPKKIK